MKNRLLAMLTIAMMIVILASGCSVPKKYSGPYAEMPLITKQAAKDQIDKDNAIMKNKAETLINQVKAKQDIKYYQMLLACYEYYEKKIVSIDGKKYTITSKSIKEFIKMKKYEANLTQINEDKSRWPALFLGNMARYFDSIGFKIDVDGSLGEENIILSW